LSTVLPSALIHSLQGVTGFDEPTFTAVHASEDLLVSVRMNPAKIDNPQSIPALQNLLNDQVPWSSSGYYLQQRPVFTIDPLFHAGAYYVQEASSMFLEQALRQTCDLTQPLKVLDLCAAPGGKSTLIQSLLPPDSLLVSNEVIKTRAGILVENLSKWGAANVVVTNNDPRDFKKLPAFFDCIVIDAPCSGSGLFRKDPNAISEWSEQNVTLCSQRQQRILADVLDALKPGGILIYSTCSYSVAEDEAIADWVKEHAILDNIRLSINPNWGIVETVSDKHHCYGYRFYPDKVKGEGFFITVFKKDDNAHTDNYKKATIKPTMAIKKEQDIAAAYLATDRLCSFLKFQDDVLAIPASLLEDVLTLQQNLYIKKAGVNMGSIIRNELIPSHEWALSTIAASILPRVEVNEATALDYLRRKDIDIDTSVRGWALLVYEGLPLGLVKILPNRLNNYYPKEWRILNK
jgi:16S rRNA C967 or C1407 C5-methylase (RsmB/RsmF family)/NOL1/NOP2/fmu family ribosome biogenesis protein